MAALTIHPLHVGTIHSRDKSVFTYLRNMGNPIDLPVFVWYIEGNGRRVLVDAGGHDPEESPLMQPYSRTAEQSPVAQLARLGVRPEEIDTLILTHLHWDHATGVHLFPNARVFVQREELRYAAAPLPPHRFLYTQIRPLPFSWDRFEVIEGDRELMDGITILHLPGHSPGTQGVVVQGENRRYLIAGDDVPLQECWDAVEKYGVAHWPNGIHIELEAFYRSFRRMEELADVVIPGHDFSVLEHGPYR